MNDYVFRVLAIEKDYGYEFFAYEMSEPIGDYISAVSPKSSFWLTGFRNSSPCEFYILSRCSDFPEKLIDSLSFKIVEEIVSSDLSKCRFQSPFELMAFRMMWRWIK